MSYLREIMGRLRERSDSPGTDTEAPAIPYSPVSEQVLASHLVSYRDHLQDCTAPMLHYEWAWLEDHLSSLELSRGPGAMQKALGGSQRVADLLRESRAFQEELRQEMDKRGVGPGSRTGPVATQEHAWELSNPAIRREWGIEPTDPLHP
jgi:hypothetical protein